jgi:Asp-tRNA(Asn)/Glu-tRNA(Gln) amidotransferase A subunit family amidase
VHRPAGGDGAAVGLQPGRAALPIGVQLIAAPWREDLCLRVAAALEAQGVCSAPMAELG